MVTSKFPQKLKKAISKKLSAAWPMPLTLAALTKQQPVATETGKILCRAAPKPPRMDKKHSKV